MSAEGLPPGLAPRLIVFFEELRNEEGLGRHGGDP